MSKALRALRSDLALLPASFPGVRVEDKGISYSIHFRGASPDARRRVQVRIRPLLSRFRNDFRMIHSNHAIEIVPREVEGKGVAMREFTRALRSPFLPIYVGDDLTDEPGDTEAKRRNGVLVIECYGRDRGARLAGQGHSPACEVEGSWIRTEPVAVVERRDRRHVVAAELEIEHVEVTRNPRRVH